MRKTNRIAAAIRQAQTPKSRRPGRKNSGGMLKDFPGRH
jgi:hypothetical protein